MPIHDYRCARCGRRFQQFFRTFADVRDPSACPHCGAADVIRLPPRENIFMVYNDLELEKAIMERLRQDLRDQWIRRNLDKDPNKDYNAEEQERESGRGSTAEHERDGGDERAEDRDDRHDIQPQDRALQPSAEEGIERRAGVAGQRHPS